MLPNANTGGRGCHFGRPGGMAGLRL